MLDTIFNRALTLAAIAAGVVAVWFWRDSEAKQDRIDNLEIQLADESGDTAAFRTLAERVPNTERFYRDAMAAVNAAGERTSRCVS